VNTPLALLVLLAIPSAVFLVGADPRRRAKRARVEASDRYVRTLYRLPVAGLLGALVSAGWLMLGHALAGSF
jgi:hypothetical protein